MRASCRYAVLFIVIVLRAIPAIAQEPDTAAVVPRVVDGVEILSFTDKHHLLHVEGGIGYNVLAVIGEETVLLVDCGPANHSEQLLKALESLTDKPVSTVILTHGHGDHTGGLSTLAPHATVLACPNATRNLFYDLAPLPIIQDRVVLVEDSLELLFNGEAIRLDPVPPAHTSGDLIVRFPQANLNAVGDLVFPMWFPFIDYSRGGGFQHYLDNLLTMAEDAPPEATFVAGHGLPFTADELLAYRLDLLETVQLIHVSLERGETPKQMIEEGLLADFAAYGHEFIDQEFWMQQVHIGLGQQNLLDLWDDQKPALVSSVATASFLEKGVDALDDTLTAVLTAARTPVYAAKNELVYLGYQFIARDHVDAGRVVFERLADAYPDYWNAWDCLAEVELLQGDTTAAVEHYTKSLELNPKNDNARTVLDRLGR